MSKPFKLIVVFGLILLMNSCADSVTSLETENLTTNNVTEEITSSHLETSTEIPTTSIPSSESTTNQTTIITSTETPLTTTEEIIEEVTIYFGNISNATFETTSLISLPGSELLLPNDPIRQGYIFTGWYIDQALTNPLSINVYPDEDITVYAKWIEEVNIDELMTALENDFDFECANNICQLEESSWLTYTFNFNNFIFKKELIDDDDSDN